MSVRIVHVKFKMLQVACTTVGFKKNEGFFEENFD